MGREVHCATPFLGLTLVSSQFPGVTDDNFKGLSVVTFSEAFLKT